MPAPERPWVFAAHQWVRRQKRRWPWHQRNRSSHLAFPSPRSLRSVMPGARFATSGLARLSRTGRSSTSCPGDCGSRTRSSTARPSSARPSSASSWASWESTISRPTPLTSTVLVHYDRKQLSQDQIIEILESAPGARREPAQKDKLDLHLPLCTASMPLAAAAQFACRRALARRGGAVCLHLDPNLQGGTRGPRRGAAAGGRCARRHRRDRLPGDHVDFSRDGSLLVPRLRPGSGQENAGRFQEAAPERLWQAAALRLALPRRRRGPDFAGPAPAAAT